MTPIETPSKKAMTMVQAPRHMPFKVKHKNPRSYQRWYDRIANVKASLPDRQFRMDETTDRLMGGQDTHQQYKQEINSSHRQNIFFQRTCI